MKAERVIRIIHKKLLQRKFSKELDYGTQVMPTLLLSKLYYLLYPKFLIFRLRVLFWMRKDSILVYQMAKVGSSTVVASLKASPFNGFICHTHFLSEKGVQFLTNSFEKTYDSLDECPIELRQHLLESYFLSKKVGKVSSRPQKYKVVTLVRDPIATNISGFFQNADLWLPELKEQRQLDSMEIKQLIERFFEEYPHEVPLTWFDSELKRVFDIDVFASEFPKSKGYHIYEGKRAEVLLLRLENLSQCANEAFKIFLNIDDFVLSNANDSSNKEYASIYNELKKSIDIPDSYFDLMYNSKYAQHFYSSKELGAFKANWCKEKGQKAFG
ncbi:hypothetical protein IID10_14755 [candidate division KSB1 bacterium]|nr:hypothetical protein [candidate division KSB1 bacterium]